MGDIPEDLPADARDEVSDGLHSARTGFHQAAGAIEEEFGTDNEWYGVLVDLADDVEIMESVFEDE